MLELLILIINSFLEFLNNFLVMLDKAVNVFTMFNDSISFFLNIGLIAGLINKKKNVKAKKSKRNAKKKYKGKRTKKK